MAKSSRLNTRVHKLLGLVVGAQLLLWTVSGLFFTLIPIEQVRGEHLRAEGVAALRRACELSQVALLDDHDWYFEGATLILESQEDNGRFQPGSVVDNCFAILFLKKASLPVFTGGGR